MRRLIIEPPMDEAQSACWTTPDERAAAAAFGAARRREYLAWRAVVRRELACGMVSVDGALLPAGEAVEAIRIGYDAVGAPTVAVDRADGRPSEGVCIAVSHCAGWVAVALSDAPCAVDAEFEGRRFARIEGRYLTPAERQLSSAPGWLAAAWCAKETLYKYAGRRNLDLRADLHLVAASLADSPSDAVAASRPAGDEGAAAADAMQIPEGFRPAGWIEGCIGTGPLLRMQLLRRSDTWAAVLWQERAAK